MGTGFWRLWESCYYYRRQRNYLTDSIVHKIMVMEIRLITIWHPTATVAKDYCPARLPFTVAYYYC